MNSNDERFVCLAQRTRTGGNVFPVLFRCILGGRCARLSAMKARPLYIGGEWRKTNTTIRIVTPATAEPFDEVCTVPRAEVAQAIEHAHAALPAWRALTGKARGEFLRKIADAVERRGEEI